MSRARHLLQTILALASICQGALGTTPLAAQEGVTLCRAMPQVPQQFADRYPIGPGSSRVLARRIGHDIEPYADSSGRQLDSAIAALSDSGFSSISSADAAELARSIQYGSRRRVTAVLEVFRVLGVDPTPLETLVGDYYLAPSVRFEVFQWLDLTRTDSVLVEAVLVSVCQLSGWLLGTHPEAHFQEDTYRLRYALTAEGTSLYLALLRYIRNHEPIFKRRAGCTSMQSCMGPVYWAYEYSR